MNIKYKTRILTNSYANADVTDFKHQDGIIVLNLYRSNMHLIYSTNIHFDVPPLPPPSSKYFTYLTGHISIGFYLILIKICYYIMKYIQQHT